MKNKKGTKYWKVWNGYSWDSFTEKHNAERYADICKKIYTANTKDIEIGSIKEAEYK